MRLKHIEHPHVFDCCWDSHLSVFNGIVLMALMLLGSRFKGVIKPDPQPHGSTRCHKMVWSCLICNTNIPNTHGSILLCGGTVIMEDNSVKLKFESSANVQTCFCLYHPLRKSDLRRFPGHHTDLKVRSHNAPAVNQVAILVFWPPWHVLSPTDSLCPAYTCSDVILTLIFAAG
jgi:hypothetical protein